MTVMTRTHTTILAITGIFGGDVLAASVVRRRRQATMLAMVTPFAEDHFPGKFGEGFARHQCHVQPDDASQQPFQAACPAMFISAYDTRHMELSLRADTVDDDEPVVVNAVPADGGNKLETAADVSGGGHCVMPHADGNSCAGRTILHMRLQFDDDGPDCKNLSDLAVALLRLVQPPPSPPCNQRSRRGSMRELARRRTHHPPLAIVPPARIVLVLTKSPRTEHSKTCERSAGVPIGSTRTSLRPPCRLRRSLRS